MIVAKLLLGTTRYEVSLKRDATTQGVHSLVMRQMNAPDVETVAVELPRWAEPGEPMALDQALVIDLPTYMDVSEPLE